MYVELTIQKIIVEAGHIIVTAYKQKQISQSINYQTGTTTI